MVDIDALKCAMTRYASDCRFNDLPQPTPVPGLSLVRARGTTELTHTDYEPIFCLVLQGAKQTHLGDQRFTFGPLETLIVTLDLPAAARVVQASPHLPYLALALRLDVKLLHELRETLGETLSVERLPAPAPRSPALAVGLAGLDLVDAMARLFSLRDRASDIAVLAPLITREIHYRLLLGDHGGVLRSLVHPDGPAGRIAQAIAEIRSSHDRLLPVADLASLSGMSASAFHVHFRDLTGTTPLQYQKSLRFMEAQRQLRDGSQSVASIAFAIGYESPTQFSREYRRKFGHPPRDERPLAV
tara:strand:- start:9456 stop:10358 length:903 start_codon:yes stop_codon:yes gene_type:complete